MPNGAGAHSGWARVGPMQPIGVLLQEHGADKAAVLAACGLAQTALDDAEGQLPMHTGGRLFQQAAWALQRVDFGLMVGQRFSLESLGLLGALLRQAPTVGAALYSIQRFFHLQDRGSVLYLRRADAGTAAIGYALHDPDIPGSGLVYDAVMAMAQALLRELCGASFRCAEVHLEHAPPADLGPYRRCFGAPVVFDAPHTELHFSAHWLDAPVDGANEQALVALRRAALASEAADPLPLDQRVRVVVRTLLLSGDLSARRVAEALGLHERTLRRRLADADLSLQPIVAEVRFAAARQLLQGTGLSLQDIAVALGYADGSSFLRAFRGWSGRTPGQWRAEQMVALRVAGTAQGL